MIQPKLIETALWLVQAMHASNSVECNARQIYQLISKLGLNQNYLT